MLNTFDLSSIINNLEESHGFLTKTEKRASIYNDVVYDVIKYKKEALTPENITTYGLCRSVVLNKKQHIVSFAPPKSMSLELFQQKYPDKTDSISAEEFVEGTMINVFWDDYWEMATRSAVGADNKFYLSENSKTFSVLFHEALETCRLTLDMLNKDYCYSFVLQHPENRIVVPFEKPQLYLVAVFKITPDTSYTVEAIDMKTSGLGLDGTTVRFPAVYDFHDYSELTEKFENTDIYTVGVIIKNLKTGERSKIRNLTYEKIRRLRGNQPKLKYHYLCLRQEGAVAEYLNYFPENKKEFSLFRDEVHAFTKQLYATYVACFITKTQVLSELSFTFKNHLYNLHHFYLNTLRKDNLRITLSHVVSKVNVMPPALLMSSL